MAFAAAIGPLISGIASIAGAMASASAMNAQADAQEQMAAWNAARQREEAAWAQSKGALEARQKEKEGEKLAAKARAAVAQSGVATTEGSPLLMQQEFAAETAWRSNIEMANATKTQRDFMNKAAITEYEGKIRAESSRAQASASLLSGFASGIGGMAKGLAGSGFG